MILIIAGHALVFMIGGPVLNADFYAKVNLSMQIILFFIIFTMRSSPSFAGNKIGTECIFS